MSVIRKVANPPAALAIINGRKGGSMPAKKARKSRSKARPRTTTAAHRAPARRPAKRVVRRKKRNPIVARARRKYSRGRTRNPGEAVNIAVGAVAAQVLGGFIPFGGGSPIVQAAKAYAAGWALQRFGGRALPMVFGRAETGGQVAAVITLLNAYVMPAVTGFIGGALAPKQANGVNGIAVTSYPFVPGGQIMPPAVAAQAARQGVRGMATAGYPMR